MNRIYGTMWVVWVNDGTHSVHETQYSAARCALYLSKQGLDTDFTAIEYAEGMYEHPAPINNKESKQ